MYAMFKFVACTVPEKTVTQIYPEKKTTTKKKKKTEKWTNKDLSPTIQQLIVRKYTKCLASILLEKTLTQIFNVNIQNIERVKNGEKIED